MVIPTIYIFTFRTTKKVIVRTGWNYLVASEFKQERVTFLINNANFVIC